MQRRPSTRDGANSPPWDRSPQPVPYLDSSAPALSSTERNALPVLWAAKDNSTAYPVRLNSSPQPSNSSSLGAPTPYHKQSSWSTVPRSSQEAQEYSRPSCDISLPTSDASSRGCTCSVHPNEGLSNIEEDPEPKVLPGTMASKNVHRRGRGRKSRSDGNGTTTNGQQHEALSHRLRAHLRDMFKRKPVDDSMFERIEDQHWTDD
jgi:hypothetical protein